MGTTGRARHAASRSRLTAMSASSTRRTSVSSPSALTNGRSRRDRRLPYRRIRAAPVMRCAARLRSEGSRGGRSSFGERRLLFGGVATALRGLDVTEALIVLGSPQLNQQCALMRLAGPAQGEGKPGSGSFSRASRVLMTALAPIAAPVARGSQTRQRRRQLEGRGAWPERRAEPRPPLVSAALRVLPHSSG
jgi:hypothetical protein